MSAREGIIPRRQNDWHTVSKRYPLLNHRIVASVGKFLSVFETFHDRNWDTNALMGHNMGPLIVLGEETIVTSRS